MAENTWQDFLQQAQDYWRSDNIDQAEATFAQVIDLCPDEPRLYFTRSQFYSDVQRLDRAIMDLSAAIKLRPQMPIYYVARAKAYTDSGDIEKAINDYTAVLGISKMQLADIYHRRALLYKKQGNLNLAIADFTAAASHNARSYRHILERANVYEEMGDVANACADLERSIVLCGADHPEAPAIQKRLNRMRDQLAPH